MTNEHQINKNNQEIIDDPYVQRVAQLDASDLDEELYTLLKEQVAKTFKYVKPRYLSVAEIELYCILKFILLWYSLSEHHATVGQRLLNIKFRNRNTSKSATQRQLIFYVGGLIGTHWIKSREDHITLWFSKYPRLKSIISWTLNWSDIGVRIVVLVNVLLFLIEGRYAAPLERLLKLRPVPASRQSIRQVSYEYLNRELLWHGFAEFVAFFVPLMNVRRLLNAVCRYIPFEFVEPTSELQRTLDDFKKCIVCDLSPTSPHSIGCRHVFCYYCITSCVLNDQNYRCPECGLQVSMHSSPRPIKF